MGISQHCAWLVVVMTVCTSKGCTLLVGADEALWRCGERNPVPATPASSTAPQTTGHINNSTPLVFSSTTSLHAPLPQLLLSPTNCATPQGHLVFALLLSGVNFSLGSSSRFSKMFFNLSVLGLVAAQLLGAVAQVRFPPPLFTLFCLCHLRIMLLLSN